MSSSHILGVGSTGPRRRWTLARVLKGSPRPLRVMAPPPLLYAYHTLGVFRNHLWCLSTPPQCGILTFTVGTCSHDVKIKKGIIVAVPGYYNEFLFCREANVIRRYLRRTTFVPSKFLCRNLRGRGGLLSFGVNLRVQELLSVDAFVSFRAKVYTDNFIK